jgi:hypothetical protein
MHKQRLKESYQKKKYKRLNINLLNFLGLNSKNDKYISGKKWFVRS